MKLFRESNAGIFSAMVLGMALQGCGISPAMDGPAAVSSGRSSATLTAMFEGQPVTLKNAHISMFTLADGAPSWILGARGPDGRGTVEITCLESAIENGTTYLLDDEPSSENAFLVVGAEGGKGLVAYSLDESQTSVVVIESIADGRVTGRFSLKLVGESVGSAQAITAELVCEHFELPMVRDTGTW